MSTAEEIKEATLSLPKDERQELVEVLPSILPELSTSDEWDRNIKDPQPRPALSALGDAIALQMKRNSEVYPIISDNDF